jgi:3D domain
MRVPYALAAAAAGALALVAASTARTTAAAPPRQCPPAMRPHPRTEHPLRRAQWLAHAVVTEYWPVPERWFVGRLVHAPGLSGRHRVDWLYSARGLPMEGEGVALDGRRYHYGGPWHVGWVDLAGRRTLPCTTGSWSDGPPAWPAFGWRNASGQVTFPLAAGGWSAGRPVRTIRLPPKLRFVAGPSRPVRYWHSVAVDRRVIPFGSRIFIPAYCGSPDRGWFTAEDSGSAINSGRHIDVYRPPPDSRSGGQLLREQRIYVVPAGAPRPRALPRCRR